jgi:hypothetical protein
MLVKCEAVSHASEIIGHNPRCLSVIRTDGEVVPLMREALRLGNVQGEEIVDDPACFRAHLSDTVMTIHPLQQKPFESIIVASHLFGEGGNRSLECPHLLGRLDPAVD